MKNTKIIAIAIALIATASVVTGCGNGSDTPTETSLTTISTSDEAATEPVLDDTETAIVSNGLTVNGEGKVIDSEGKEVKTTADGKIKVKAADGKVIEVSTEKIKETNNKSSNGSSSSKNSSTEKKNSDTSEGKPTQNSGNTSQNSGSTANGNSSNKGNTEKNTQNSSKGNKSDSSSSKSQPTTADPHAGKTWHEAVYKTVNHPAETKKVKVVDQEAYTYEEPVYELKKIHKCKDCGMDLLTLSADERDTHAENHVLAGGDGGWYTAQEQVQVGTRTVTVPEKYHYETVVVKEAWTEKVLVKEAGWY